MGTENKQTLIPITPDMLTKTVNADAKQVVLVKGQELERIDFKDLAMQVGVEANDFAFENITLITPEPTKKGFYFPTESGVYSNFGGIEVTEEKMEELVLVIIFDGINYELIEKSFPALGEIKRGDNRAVSGGEVFNSLLPINNLFKKSINLANWQDFKGQIWDKNSSQVMVPVVSANWISLAVKNLTNQQYNMQGYSSTIGGTNEVIIFADSENKYISGITKTALDLANGDFTPPTNAVYTYVRIANIIGIGNDPTNNVFVDSFMISEGAGNKNFERFGGLKLEASNVVEDYPKFIIKMTPVTAPYTGTMINQSVAHVYERLKDNIYIRHSLVYQRLDYEDYVSGDFSGGKIVRYAGSQSFAFNKETKTFTALTVLVTANESEFVLSKGYWSGGYHGNEDFSNVYFVIDAKVYNPTGDVDFPASDLIYCDSFSYIMSSQLKLHSDKSVLAERVKKSDFVSGGFDLSNKFQFKQTGALMAYVGVMCVGKHFTSVVSDSAKYVIPTGSNLYPIDSDHMARQLTYSSNDYDCTVTNCVQSSEIDKQCGVLLWDRAADTKYYRQLPSYNPAIDEYFEINSRLEIFKK